MRRTPGVLAAGLTAAALGVALVAPIGSAVASPNHPSRPSESGAPVATSSDTDSGARTLGPDYKVSDHKVKVSQKTKRQMRAEPTAPQVLNEFLSKAASVGKPSALRNFSHYGEVGGNIDDLVAKAVAETDTAKQLAYLKEAQLQVLRDVPVVSLQTAPIITAMHGKLDLGFKPVSGYGQYDYSTAKLVNT